MEQEFEATRHIGTATVRLNYIRDARSGGGERPIYAGEILAGGLRYTFDDVGGPVYGSGSRAVDAAESFDEIASAAVNFAIHEGGDTGEAIGEATQSALQDDGTYVVRRANPDRSPLNFGERAAAIVREVGGQETQTWPFDAATSPGERYFLVPGTPIGEIHVRVAPREDEIEVHFSHTEGQGTSRLEWQSGIVARHRDPEQLLGSLKTALRASTNQPQKNPASQRIGTKLKPFPAHLHESVDTSGASTYHLAHEGRRYLLSTKTGDLVDAFSEKKVLLVLSLDAAGQSIALDVIDAQAGHKLAAVIADTITLSLVTGFQFRPTTKTVDVALAVLRLMAVIPGEQ